MHQLKYEVAAVCHNAIKFAMLRQNTDKKLSTYLENYHLAMKLEPILLCSTSAIPQTEEILATQANQYT